MEDSTERIVLQDHSFQSKDCKPIRESAIEEEIQTGELRPHTGREGFRKELNEING
jgi:hypothetical protein